MTKAVKPAPKKGTRAKTKLATITFDQWAASGGTGGIFAADVRAGRTKIVEDDYAV